MSDRLEGMYQEKNQAYFSNIRHDVVSLIHGTGLRILEVGCGSGATLIHLKQTGKAKEVIGIEINESSLLHTKSMLDGIYIGNIENMQLEFPENYFDIIIFADVLEHLINPWEMLQGIKKYLKSEGSIVASLPNIRKFNILWSILIKGDFKYEDEGILDRTHLRFFCKKNMIDLFVKSGMDVVEVRSNPIIQGGKKGLFNKLTFGKFEEFFPVQYLLVAKRNKHKEGLCGR